MTKNSEVVRKRLLFIRDEMEKKGNKSMTQFVEDISNRLFLSKDTIWKQIKILRDYRNEYLN
jgi:hypothetical protein